MTTKRYTAKELLQRSEWLKPDPELSEMLRQAAEDAERLEFIAYHFRVSGLDMGGQHHWTPSGALGRMRGPTFVDAIDAARTQEKACD